jgi:hypothetical protein
VVAVAEADLLEILRVREIQKVLVLVAEAEAII